MFVQFVQFETSLSEDEVMAVAEARAPQFRAIDGLVQKFYLKLNKPNHYGGFYVWKSREAMLAFRETELAKTIPAAYKVVAAPDIDIHEFLFALREEGVFAPDAEPA
ncbi:hypothetical protein [Tropicimonas sp. IMCC6043]|uniref:hypothetical protein n=1 Tax=Tropicimonas sp. IMCC6043 TaxID=2510645 RepID=UPI00101BE5A1|nr:hypothetical protein [Tropicimonas sp. IMCC6043]RYH09614.1 hypothetical protein EU800_11740 [Tropicimonas sp. IMCC6043]